MKVVESRRLVEEETDEKGNRSDYLLPSVLTVIVASQKVDLYSFVECWGQCSEFSGKAEVLEANEPGFLRTLDDQPFWTQRY